MKIMHSIKARYLADLIYCLSSDVLLYFGLAADDYDELTFDMLTEYLEYLSNNNEIVELLGS